MTLKSSRITQEGDRQSGRNKSSHVMCGSDEAWETLHYLTEPNPYLSALTSWETEGTNWTGLRRNGANL